MVQINGKYQHIKNENLLEHLLAWGIPADRAKETDSEHPVLSVTLDGKKFSLTSDSKNSASHNYIIDEEIDEVMGPLKGKTTTKINDNVITVSSVVNGQTGERIFTFSEDGLVLVLTKAGLPDAKRYYKKL